jgi:predicted phosphoribosyltransferase
LKYLLDEKAVILGIPRGGIIVAAEISCLLNAELDIVLSRKLGAPGNPELAIGSIGEGGKLFLNENLAWRVGPDKNYIERERTRQLAEINNRTRRFRQVKAKVYLKGKIAVVTDDGVATGATMQAALWAARQEKPKKLIAAIPVGAKESLELLVDFADEVIVLRVPEFLGSVSQFYVHFDQNSDEEVSRLLKESTGIKEASGKQKIDQKSC